MADLEINITPEEWSDLNTPNGVVIIGQSGKGRSRIIDALERARSFGWGSLDEKDQELFKGLFKNNDHFQRWLSEQPKSY